MADVLVALAVEHMAGSARIGNLTLRLSSDRLETKVQILLISLDGRVGAKTNWGVAGHWRDELRLIG